MGNESQTARPWPTDMDAFNNDMAELGATLRQQMGTDDNRHLRKMVGWGRACTFLGLATAWIAPNPVSPLLISLGRTSRWAMVAHHVGHKGYDRVDGPKGKDFAEGWRRWEWLDWLLPAAWKHEHNKLHHYRLNELRDPDLVEENMRWLREGGRPMWQRLVLVGFFMLTWKWSYYAPNTLAEYLRGEVEEVDERSIYTFNPATPMGRALWLKSFLPYMGVWFGLVPLLFVPLGWWAAFSVFVNSVLAEFLTNVHTFCIIVPNHAGADLYRFEEPGKGRGEFYFRQVVGSVNYRTGGNLNDFLHGFLNYQIEHHLWPDLSMLAYQRAQPQVKALCEKHGLPYVQESVFKRVKRTVRIMIGTESMKTWETLPPSPFETRPHRPEANAIPA